MATLDSFISVNMFKGFNFSALLAGPVTSSSSTDYRVEQVDTSYDWLFGTGLFLGPDADGALPEPALQSLRQAGRLCSRNLSPRPS